MRSEAALRDSEARQAVTRHDIRPTRGNLTSAARVVSLAVAAVATVLLLVVVLVPQLLGAQSLSVLSGSMAPAISPGDVVVIRPVPADELAVGDVVSYQPRPGPGSLLVTHRVVDRRTIDGQAFLLTKGDANAAADADLVPVDAVRGRVAYIIPFVGHLREQSPAQGLLVILALFGTVGYVTLPLSSRRRDDDAPSTQDAHDAPDVLAGTLAAELVPPADAMPADLLLAVLPLGLGEDDVDDALRTWRGEAPVATPEPVLQSLRSGAVVVAAAGWPDDLNILARSLSDLVASRKEPAPPRRTSNAGRSARDVVLD